MRRLRAALGGGGRGARTHKRRAIPPPRASSEPQELRPPRLEPLHPDRRCMLQGATPPLVDGAQAMRMASSIGSPGRVASYCPDALLEVVKGIESDDQELPAERCRGFSHAPLLGAPPPAPKPTPVTVDAVMGLCPTTELRRLSSPSPESESESESDSKDEKGGEEDEENAIVRVPRPCVDAQLSPEQMDAVICADVEALEAQQPWRFVFRCLEVPFHFSRDQDPFDAFFLRWDAFWRAHGHAVWERSFWKPLPVDSRESHRRRHRQMRAMCAFRELAADLLARLGASLQQRLARRLHDGWWYRTEPFALRRLFHRSRHLYEQYLVRRVRERWPRGRKFLVLRSLRPVWWVEGPAAGAYAICGHPDKDDE